MTVRRWHLRVPELRQVITAAAFALAMAALVLMALSEPGARYRFGGSVTQDPRDVRLLPLRDLTQAVGFLREGYAYPDRLRPRAMLLAALRSLQDGSPALLVTEDPLGEEEAIDSVTLRTGDETGTWDLRRVDDLYAMNWVLMEILGRFAPHLDQPEDTLEEEALEGMLSTLDPHTVYLDPKDLQEMQMSTTGRFGGLGIVISVRDGRLRIVSVMEDTPAAEAGLAAGDHILQIGDESTESMTVSEAATRLRGEPGTTVTLWVGRKGLKAHRRLDIERRVIRVRSVEAHMLPEGIGWIWVKSFQKGTADEVRSFLEDHRAELRGVILDVRDDTGGIMQEAVELSDLFLARGVIVNTRSRVEEEDEEDIAGPGDPWEDVPLVVLLNHATASASEIVAGALKMSGRATLVGSRSFGKGSIQFLRELTRGALKMTVAQYLTTGGVSVQARGIEPHVELIPMFLEAKQTWLAMPPPELVGEEDLPNRLRAAAATPDPFQPVLQLHYISPLAVPDGPAEGEEPGEPGDEVPEPVAERPGDATREEDDVALQVARVLLAVAGDAGRTGDALVELALPELDAMGASLQEELAIALAARGVEWEARATVPSPGELEAWIDPPADPIPAGEEADAWLQVRSRGTQPLESLHAVVYGSAGDFGPQDCLLGRLEPGATGSCRVSLAPAAWSPLRRDLLWMDLYSLDELLLSVGPVTVETRGASFPRLAASLLVAEADGETKAGLVMEAGGDYEIELRLWNLGEAPLLEGVASLKPLEDGRVYVVRGRESVPELKPGGEATLRFRLRVRPRTEEGAVDLRVFVTDAPRRRSFSWTVPFPIVPSGGAPTAPGRVEQRSLGPTLFQPGFILDSASPGGGMGTATSLVIGGSVDLGPVDVAGVHVAAYVNGEKRSVVSLGGRSPAADHRFSFSLPMEVGPNRIVLSVIRARQSQSHVELFYNRLR